MSNNPNPTLEENIENTLFENITAVGVREGGLVRDLDTLIIDREKTVQALLSLYQKELVSTLSKLTICEYDDQPAQVYIPHKGYDWKLEDYIRKALDT